ncbi:MAG: hypothetical protein U0797_12390 [Gemmataceae bacterium]
MIDLMGASRRRQCQRLQPEDLLVSPGGVMLVDHETAHVGEPAMDLGFFFSHLLLKGVRLAATGRRTAGRLYSPPGRCMPRRCGIAPPRKRCGRGFGHLGVCLLARIDGTSPVDYLPEEPKPRAARRLGRGLLMSPASGWDEVFARL